MHFLNNKDVVTFFKICGYAILVTVIIHILFKIKAPFEFLEAEWSAGEYLTFMAGFLTFAGTFILSIHTLKSANKYQEIANKLAEDNNSLQEILAQNMLPVLNIISAEVFPAERQTKVIEEIQNRKQTFLVGRHYKKEESNIIIYLNADVEGDYCNLRTMRLTVENISQVPIRYVAIPKIIINGYKNCFETIICYNKNGQDCGRSDAIRPNHSVMLDINIYYLNDAIRNVWDSDLGWIALTLFFENVSYAGIKFKQSIGISVANNKMWDVKFGDKDSWD